MNAGLTNLAKLKAWLLPDSMTSGADYDEQILAIGKGVAAQLEQYCNRKFARAVGDIFETPGFCLHVVLPRYPLEAAPAIERRDDIATGYVAEVYNNIVVDHNLAAGLIKFGAWAGTASSRLRFTFTGGWFWEQLEPADVGYPTAQPAGSTAVPDDVLLAWRLQCEQVWKQRDKLGLNLAEKPDNVFSGALARVALLDAVKETLRPHMRMTLS